MTVPVVVPEDCHAKKEDEGDHEVSEVDGDGNGNTDDSDNDSDGGSDSDSSNSPGSSTSDSSAIAIDHPEYHTSTLSEAQSDAFHTHPTWLAHYCAMIMTIARLYIFADKYRMTQLKDDIMTVLVVQCSAWGWWPYPAADLMSLIYGNLPRDCGLIQFLVLSAAFMWVTHRYGHCEEKLLAIRDMHPDFAFDISIALADWLKDRHDWDGERTLAVYFDKCQNTSCPFHDHLLLDKDACRKRIANPPYIFTGMIEAFAEAAKSDASTA